MRLAELETLRGENGRTALLFLTDRCPVGCAHCSVDSRPNSPSISDRSLFEGLIRTLSHRSQLKLVGISGGEPFVERWGLERAVSELTAGGKEVVVYTSGVWAREAVPAWTRPVLSACTTVVLSTDAFHAASIDEARLSCALEAIVAAGADLVVQTLKLPDAINQVERLLRNALGKEWHARADISLVPPLPYGRGRNQFAVGPTRAGHSFGCCRALNAPVVRYDGQVAACCNEQVIMGAGPPQLRRKAGGARELEAVLEEFAEDPLLTGMRAVGCGALAQHPRFAGLGEEQHSSICSLCWRMHGRLDGSPASSDRLLAAISSTIGGGRR